MLYSLRKGDSLQLAQKKNRFSARTFLFLALEGAGGPQRQFQQWEITNCDLIHQSLWSRGLGRGSGGDWKSRKSSTQQLTKLTSFHSSFCLTSCCTGANLYQVAGSRRFWGTPPASMGGGNHLATGSGQQDRQTVGGHHGACQLRRPTHGRIGDHPIR